MKFPGAFKDKLPSTTKPVPDHTKQKAEASYEASGTKRMKSFFYVYVLVSKCGTHRYVGLTEDLEQRLRKHNSGGVSHTSKHRPWGVETAIAFRSREKAAAFERYLKSGSGREFARRHF